MMFLRTKVQKLYFDQSFILKRLDYTTDVLGGVRHALLLRSDDIRWDRYPDT